MEKYPLRHLDQQAAINRALATILFLRVIRLIQFDHWREFPGRRLGELHVQ